MSKKLEEAVKNWILAEYAFRFGDKHYSFMMQQYFVEAEAELRRVFCGKKGLIQAGQKLGGKAFIPLGGAGEKPAEKMVKKVVKKTVKKVVKKVVRR